MSRHRNPTPSTIGDAHDRQGATGSSPAPPLPLPGGFPDPSTGKPTPHPWEKKPQRGQRSRRREIRRRQRLLRQAGFKIAVDGVWGPRSQRLWNRYLKNRSVVFKDKPIDELDLSDPRSTPRPTRQEVARAKRVEKRKRAEATRKRQMRVRRQAILSRAEMLKRDPTKARELTIPQIAEVLTDKEVDYDPTKNVNLTRALQYKLLARGYKLKVNGRFDAQTAKALKQSEDDFAARRKRQMAQLVIDRLYKPGHVKPGDKPHWATYEIPTPGELLKMVQGNTFMGALIFQDLLDRVVSPEVAWQQVKANNLARIANTVAQGGVGATMYRLTGDANAVPLWQYMVDIYGIQDFVPQVDYSFKPGMTESLRREAVKARANNKWVIEENDRRKQGVRDQVGALMASTSPKDFQFRMWEMSLREEHRFKKLQLEMASQQSPWWGDVIDTIFYPGELLRTGLVQYGMNFKERFSNITTPGDAELKTARDAERWIEDMNPIARFAFEATVDPLNLIAPARVASASAALSLRAFGRGASLGRYTLVGGPMGKALTYTKGTWSKIDVSKALISADDPFRIADSRLAEKMEDITRKLARTKDETMAGVSQRLKAANRLGWKVPSFVVHGVEVAVPKFGGGEKGREAERWMKMTMEEMAEIVRTAPPLRRLLETLKARNGSLYARHVRDARSFLGAEIGGYMAESFRPLLAAQLALRTANDNYLAKISDEAMEGLSEKARRELVEQARTEAEIEYQTILRGFGTWRAGGGDEKLLRDYGGKDLWDELESRVAVLNEQVENIILPGIQDELERHADLVLEQAKQKHKLASDTVLANAKPVEHGGAQDFLRYAETGDAGYQFVNVRKGRAAIYRDENGKVVGHVLVGDNDSVRVFVSPEHRRKGIATNLYKTLEENGVPIERISGKGEITGEGAAFFAGRRAKATQHGIWDESGNWRGAASHQEGDLMKTVRESFENPIRIKNHRYMKSHTSLEVTRIVTRDLKRHLGRLDDYAARRIATGFLRDEDKIVGAAAHDAKEQQIIEDVTKHWKKGDDGMWYDHRPYLHESRLYARHLGAFDKPLEWNEDGIDVLAFMGRATAPSDMDEMEKDLFMLAGSMANIWGGELAGSGFRTPGITGAYRGAATETGRVKGHAEILRDAIDRRAYALRLAEESALPAMLREQMAIWRAFQYAQGRKTQLAYKGLSAQLALWKFATLALRPAWAIRNFIDNVAKGLIAGARDPRYYIVGPSTGRALQTVFDVGINQIRDVINYFDSMFGTTVGKHFDEIAETFWSHSSETLSRIFKAQLVEVPPEVLEMGLRKDIWDKSSFRLLNVADDKRLSEVGADPSLLRPAVKKKGEENLAERTRDVLWEIMGNAPENYMRRVIYRDEYAKALKALSKDESLNSVQVHLAATKRAVQKVEDTLFDYGKISVAEDNLKVIFPFIQFWRKNSVFWIESMASKPWLPMAILHFDDLRREEHADLPLWMERYFHTDEIADALAVVPGLEEAFDHLGLGDGAMFDPISMTSMAPFYRAFKTAAYGENEFLMADRQARIKVVGAIIDSLNDWGLGMSPFFRKPLEAAGVANYRAWQRVFPQTGIVEAIANATGQESIARLVVSMEKIASLEAVVSRAGGVPSDEIAANFDYWVQTEVAGQVARGEEPDIARAEQTIRDWFLVQNLWGYFGGIYWRRATPEDMYLAKLADSVYSGGVDYESLTREQKKLLRLWGMRGMDRMTYDRYIELQPVIEAYYRATDFETKDEIKADHPEIIRWVEPSFTGKPVSQKFVRYAQRYVDQEMYFEALDIADSLDVAPEIRDMVEGMFLSPELKAFWEKNNTPTRTRRRMLQAEVRDYFNTLTKGYFAIPEKDYEARDKYLEDHPELPRYWSKNDDPGEASGAILGSAKADLRDIYFRIVESNGGDEEGFAAAADFLKQYSFMFEGTPSEKKIKDGEWIPGGGRWSAERIADYRAAKPHLTWFFDKLMPKVGAKEAFAWMEKSDSEAAQLVKMYLRKYPSSKRLAWLKASPHLKVYFGLPPEKRGEWLRGDTEGAKIVREFFAKYGDRDSQHATDYLAAKKDLDFYFKMPKEKRNEWLQSDDPRAEKVLAYFKKYGKENQMARAFKKLVEKYPELRHGTPEQVRRMNFWREYYSLTPDQRPLFVLNNAEGAGIFIYGEFGEKYNYDREQEYMRRAVGLGLSKRQSAYLFVKPLMDFYRKLPKNEKPLFLQANPELQWYFDNFTNASPTGDKKLDKLVDRYFSLPAESFARSEFLRKHPEVQDWFDKRSTPAEAAMRNLLEQYFAMKTSWERQDFLLDHPEIQTYFDMRRDEKRSEQEQREAFDDADPRLAPFYENAEDLLRAAERMRAKLRQSALDALTPDGIETRRERRRAA